MKTNQGLNGFWGWLKRNVHKIAAVCTAVGLAPLAIALEAISTAINDTSSGGSGNGGDMGDNTLWKTGDYEPTSSESAILDSWVLNKLTPFYKNLLLQLKSAFESTNHDYQLQIINDVIMKMCVVRSYYATFETNGLSASAVNLRNELVDNIFHPVDDMISNSILNDTNTEVESYQMTINNPSQFLPLNIQNITVDCERYVSHNIGTQNNQNAEPLLTSIPVVVNPITNQVIPNTSTINSTSKKSNLGLVILSLLGLAVLFYPDDKKKHKK